jgi:hypothetical protein
VDAHVHIHTCFDLPAFLTAAAWNFDRAAAGLGLGPGTLGCLLLTEAEGADAFGRLRGIAGGGAGEGWSVRATGEADSLLVGRAGKPELVIVAGRQLALAGGLEVLALLTDAGFPAGMPLPAAVAEVRARGGIPVVPWGFGKWWLRRGAVVRAALEGGPATLFLGDNGGRAVLGGHPRLFRRAEALGVPVLPGSDPLPFPDHQGRAGSYGFVLEGALPLDAPAGSLRERIGALRSQPLTYGRLRPPGRFAVDQVRMQLRRRSPRSA